MIENLHGTFTLAIFISSIAILASLLLFNFVLWPILKMIMKDGYKIYVPFVFLFMSFVIFKDRFLL